MRDGWRIWVMFVSLCLMGPALAILYWQQSPARPVLVTTSDGQTGIHAVMDEAASLLSDFQRRYQHLPCPIPPNADAALQERTEAVIASQHVCEWSSALENGAAEGELPWRALGMVKDPKLHYRTTQDAIDPARCHLASTSFIAVDSESLARPHASSPLATRAIRACPAPALASVAVVWDKENARWQWAPQYDTAPVLPLPPQEAQSALSIIVSQDAAWLASVDHVADEAGVKWLRWWRLSSDRRHWISVGRWHVPERAVIAAIRFSGARLFVLHSVNGRSTIVDIPIWPHARPVAYHAVNAAQGITALVALTEGRGVMLKGQDSAWEIRVIDKVFGLALAKDHWPVFALNETGAAFHPSGMRALSWDAKGNIRLWSMTDVKWSARTIRLGAQTTRERHVPLEVRWDDAKEAVYIWDGKHWHGVHLPDGRALLLSAAKAD